MTCRYGPDESRRMLRCRTCQSRFSEREGTPLFGAEPAPEKVEKQPASGGNAALVAEVVTGKSVYVTVTLHERSWPTSSCVGV